MEKRQDDVRHEKKFAEHDGIAHQMAMETGARVDRMTRFNARQGHGVAAEQANHLLDKMHGIDSIITGDNNAKNGPDRIVEGRLVQTKYCQTAADSVKAAFGENGYRYIDADGRVMMLEVPHDQYAEAVKCMERRIVNGEVPGVKNPADAKQIVKQGNVDYQTARNIAKAGNIDSLLFDSGNGAVVATSAMGITAAITFAHAVWTGRDTTEATELAACQGLKMGGMTFASSVLAAQLTRTSLNKALLQPSIHVVRMLPSNVRKMLVDSMRKGSVFYGQQATKDLAKLLRSNVIANAAFVVVLSAGDIKAFFRGRISGKQLFKNVSTLVAGLGGGCAAGAAAGSVFGPLGTVFGGLIGGTLTGKAAHAILEQMIEDDAVAMVGIINERIVPLAQSYLLSEEELAIVIDDLQRELQGDKLLRMFASDDRERFADDLLTHIIEQVIRHRVRVRLPSGEAFLQAMGYLLERGLTPDASVSYFPGKPVNAQSIGKRLLGRDVSEKAARKAWYVTKQTNLIGLQQEQALRQMQQTTHGSPKTEQNLATARQAWQDTLDSLK